MQKLTVSWNEVTKLTLELCRQLQLSDWRPDYVVGLTRGGLVPATLLSHHLSVPMMTLDVSLRDSDVGPESNLWMAEEAFGYNMEIPKKILVVDDINDTGATFNWIMDDWRSGCLPDNDHWNYVFNHNVKFCVLFDNLASQCKVKMDYSAREINKAENDVWVDFPWEEWWLK